MQDQKTLDFLQKLKDSGHWNDDYDYSKVEYVNNATKIVVIDKKLGTQHSLIPCHMLHSGTKCIIKNAIDKTGYIINQFREVHGDKYDYSLVNYIGNRVNIKIICSEHGEFEQLPSTHLKGSGCQKCSINNISWSTEEFIQKLKERGYWRDDYDYSLIEYKNSTTNIIVIDKNTGFKHLVNPRGLLGGDKCTIQNVIDKNVYLIEQFKKVHGDKYDYLLVNYKNSSTKVKIVCPEHGEFEQAPSSHKNGQGCQKCAGTVKLTTEEIINQSKETHENKYDYSKVDFNKTKEKITIICPEHGEFEQAPSSHKNGQGCQKCAGTVKLTTEEFLQRLKDSGNWNDKCDYSKVDYKGQRSKVTVIEKSNGSEHHMIPMVMLGAKVSPNIRSAKNKNEYLISEFKEVHEDKYDYSKVEYVNDGVKIIIICPEHGEFEQTPNAHKQNKNCPKCVGGIPMSRDEVINQFKEVHGDKYDYSKFVYDGNNQPSIIICPEHGEFKQAAAYHKIGSGCLVCNHGWFTKTYKLELINQLHISDLLTMDPVELSIIIQQGKLPIDFRLLVNTGAESEERITTLRELQERYESEEERTSEESINNDVASIEPELVENDEVDAEITNISAPIEREPRLPLVNQIRDLHSLDNSVYVGMDEEAFQTLVQYKLRKIWNSMLNKEVDIDKLNSETGGKYFTMIKEEFLSEYELVSLIEPSIGYNFKDKSGNIAQPNLMQKLTVYRLLKNKYYGNWSGTGAGKTISFILASRNMDARLTIVIALNSTIEQTCKSIKSVYPDSKCFTEYNEDYIFDRNNHNYLVLNYEKFQQDKSEAKFQSLTNNNQIDFIVIDEVHNAKQREEENESARRIVMTRLLGRARENKNLHVLAMSATPVINNLFEAKSLLQLMSGLEYEDLQTRRTRDNAISIFQQLTLNGLRFIPKYDINVSELTGRNMSNLNIDGSHLLDALLNLTPNDYIGVEKLILNDKLQAITSYLRKGTIIYSYFTTGIINKIQKHVESLGFKVGTYTGEESTQLRTQNLKDFISGKIDILIGSRPIGTGVDGLQYVCNRMICITLPWTDSEYTQLKGRIYRPYGEFDGVEIIIPQVRIELEDEVWSWDIQRLNLIKNKKTLADAAVDGVIPSNAIPTPETMLRRSIESLKNWQDRVSSGNVISSNRKTLQINLYPEVDDEQERLRRINSELSEFNRRGKTTRSETMHKEFTDNPDSWRRYHTLRKSRMESWEEIPYEYIATKITDRNDIIADFGCGENLFRKCIPNNKVYAFDHIAIDDTVIACDMKNTGLDDEAIDVVVFSLALWGVNHPDYIKEAYRVLRRKGIVYIAEPSKDYETVEDQQVLINMIKDQGFQQVGVIENRGKFIYLIGIKI